MKIGILGAHGTGKSTIAKQLSGAMGVPMIEEQARVAAGLGFQLDHKTTFAAQIAMWTLQLKEEFSYESFVADRTILDACVYAGFHVFRFTDDEALAYRVILDATRTLIQKRYDILFYTPILFPLVNDGVRATEVSYQKKIDDKFQDYFRSWELPTAVLPAEKRLESALAYVG